MDVCTIIAKNYVPQARVLGESLAAFHPDARFHVLVIDEIEGFIDPAQERFAVLSPHEIGLPDFKRMAGIYDLLELSTAVKPWLLQTLLARNGEGVVYLDPDMRLYAPIDGVFDGVRDHGVVVSPHNLDPMPRDGKRPNEQDILIAGAYNLGFIGLRAGEEADHLLSWWGERLETDCVVDPKRGFFVDQRWIDLVPGMVEDFYVLRDRGFNVAYWNLASRAIGRDGDGRWLAGGTPLRLFHFSGFDARKPHLLSKHQNRIELSSHPELAELCRSYADELVAAGALDVADWPYTYGVTASGAPLNRTLRGLYRAAVLDDGLEASLFDSEGEQAFLDTLNAPAETGGEHGVTRYLAHLWDERADLQRAYPQLDRSEDAEGFLGWAHIFGIGEVPPPLLPARGRPSQEPREELPPPPPAAVVAPLQRPFGVNVAGYLRSELGVGEVARQAIAALDQEAIPLLPVAVQAPLSRAGHAMETVAPEAAAFPVNLLCVNADMLPQLAVDLGNGFFGGRYSIGWWWWEVSRFPERWMGSFDHVHELWAGSRFVAETLRAVSPVPVTRIPVAVQVPGSPAPDRPGLGLPDGPLFLYVFDHHSVFERKNPLGLLDAFLRAFPAPGEATLVIKTINAEHHPDEAERLRQAAAPHEHVQLMERYLSAEEKNRLVASCDAYVSLHRSEGFGMTMAEAMLLGKPVIATGYSGNLDFMTDENALLVRHRVVPVGPGSDPYPADAEWAEPDLDHAAELMRRVVEEPLLAAELGARAAVDIQRTNGVHVAAQAMRRRLEVIQGRLPPEPHDFLVAAGEHARAAGELARGGPARGRARNPVARFARRVMLRVMRPYTNHAGRIHGELAVALGDLAAEVGRLRTDARQRLVTESMALRRIRQLERSAAAFRDPVGEPDGGEGPAGERGPRPEREQRPPIRL